MSQHLIIYLRAVLNFFLFSRREFFFFLLNLKKKAYRTYHVQVKSFVEEIYYQNLYLASFFLKPLVRLKHKSHIKTEED